MASKAMNHPHIYKADILALGSIWSSISGVTPFVWLQAIGIIVPTAYYLVLLWRMYRGKR